MKKIDKITRKRQKIARIYLVKLAKIPGIRLPFNPKDGELNFQSLVILLPKNIAREKVIQQMQEKNIETTLGTYAMHSQKSFSGYGYEAGKLPNSYDAQERSLTLPLYGKMTNKEIESV